VDVRYAKVGDSFAVESNLAKKDPIVPHGTNCNGVRSVCEHTDMRNRGLTIWLTGLPCSGKSTLARMLRDALQEAGRFVEILDGDEVRQNVSRGLGFSKKDREQNGHNVISLAQRITQSGGIAIAATVSPYRMMRHQARAAIGQFAEVFVSCPLAVCIARDVKGHYSLALRGVIPHFTGISDPYEPPDCPEIAVRTDIQTIGESVTIILEGLVKLGHLPQAVLCASDEGTR